MRRCAGARGELPSTPALAAAQLSSSSSSSCSSKTSRLAPGLLPRYCAAGWPYELPPNHSSPCRVSHLQLLQATMRGSYFMLKVNMLISFWILQPLYRLCMAVLKLVGAFLCCARCYAFPAVQVVCGNL